MVPVRQIEFGFCCGILCAVAIVLGVLPQVVLVSVGSDGGLGVDELSMNIDSWRGLVTLSRGKKHMHVIETYLIWKEGGGGGSPSSP
jgi:hypothetical protein